MFEGLMRGTNIFYRGYVIHEEIKAISYTIYGERPVRSEIARIGSFTQAMELIDKQVYDNRPVKRDLWAEIFAGEVLQVAIPT